MAWGELGSGFVPVSSGGVEVVRLEEEEGSAAVIVVARLSERVVDVRIRDCELVRCAVEGQTR
jgi:hypothetical protein